MPSGDALPSPGEVFAGKYRIERILGRGGMGVVLGAHHLHLDERVAIKFLLPELSDDGALVARFLREGRASIKIRSEHVARVLDVETLPGGTPYMVMEYLDGFDLGDRLEKEGKLPIVATCDYVLQALEALAEAHTLGMVHRDLKPSNLFVVRLADETPCVKLLDFGITKHACGATGGDLGMTNADAVMGSPRYMAPEQMRSSRAVDSRADIWSIGIILHELLSGAPPFDGDTLPDLLVKVLEDAPAPLRPGCPDAPPALERVVARCLEKDPSRRYADVGELARELAPFGSPAAHASAEKVTRVLAARRGAVLGAGPTAAAASPAVTARAWVKTGQAATGSRRAVVGSMGLVVLLAALALWRGAVGRLPWRPAGGPGAIAVTATAPSAPPVAEGASSPPPPAPRTPPSASSLAAVAAPSAAPQGFAKLPRHKPGSPLRGKPAPSAALGNDLFEGRQ